MRDQRPLELLAAPSGTLSHDHDQQLPRGAMIVTTPVEDITTYQFNNKMIRHQFCSTCGCAPFGEGEMLDGSKMAAINLRCVDGFDLKSIKINEVDGASF